MIVEYWELVQRSGWWPRRKESVIDSPGEFPADIQIASGAGHSLRFTGADYFDWGVHALRGRSVFVRLHVAGRKRRVQQKLTA